ncbi:MAG TPA: sulfite exporter TauE/SafE family protein [Acidimicrobiales bacterium]|nr:sulfite exporter TauE/SafE family protein [Acidimicrobiales bacterium]
MIVLAIPVGVVIGLALGALGGGGSILTVPALVYLLHQGAHGATAASLIIVGITAVAGVGAHWRSGRVRVGLGAAFGLVGVAGSFVGSRLSSRVAPDVLLAAFSVLIAVAAATMLRQRQAPNPEMGPAAAPTTLATGGTVGAARVQARPPIAPVSARRLVVAASLVGLITGFFGVGGGFVVVPALVLGLGLEMRDAVGTSLVVIAINSASALMSRVGTHVHLDLPVVFTFTAAAVAGTLAGSRLASRTRPARLVSGFAMLLLGVSIYTAARSFPHLL